MAQLEGEARGINGLSTFLRSQGLTLDKMMADLAAEAIEVEKKMMGAPAEVTHQQVDEVHAARVKAARVAT